MILAAESVRLQGVFASLELPALFVKGAALAQLAYGSPLIKHSRDIDVLVAPADAERALALLEAEGYAPIAPKGATDAGAAADRVSPRTRTWNSGIPNAGPVWNFTGD